MSTIRGGGVSGLGLLTRARSDSKIAPLKRAVSDVSSCSTAATPALDADQERAVRRGWVVLRPRVVRFTLPQDADDWVHVP